MTATAHKELAPERWARLLELVHQHGAVRVDELCEHLQVSAATVRRDLEELGKRGDLQRVHGGAVWTGGRLDEPPFDDKASIAAEEKRRIAERALAFIEADDTIYLDGGSTVLFLSRLIQSRTDLTVVTNSLRAAHELATGGPRLILVGGELRRRSQTMVGPLTRLTLRELNVDKAFIGTMGFSVNDGLTTTDASEAFTKELIIRQSSQVILLTDSEKCGKVSFMHFADIDAIDALVTDTGMDEESAASFRDRGIDVSTV